MKNFIQILTVAAVLALGVKSHAQTGPNPQVGLVAGSGFIIPGLTHTNIPIALAPAVYVGRDGVFCYIQTQGTNALTVTNSIATLELNGGPQGTNVIDNQTYSISFLLGGTGFREFGTNLGSSTPNLLNAPRVRLASITNVNSQSIIISNVTFYSR